MTVDRIIKDLAHDLGADLCGIASADRFQGAPRGFQPRDIFPQTRSAVVVAKRFPEGPFHCISAIPYTAANDILLADLARIVVRLCCAIEQQTDARAVPVLGEPYEYWDADRREGRGLLSLKHAGWLAGLGVITRNGLLTSRDYGNRICLGAALVDIDLPADEVADYSFGCEQCGLCIKSCPVGAIDGPAVNQHLCRGHSENRTAKGYPLHVCHLCRSLCPHGAGR